METNEQRKQRILNRKCMQTFLERYTTVLTIEASGSTAWLNQQKLINEATDTEKGLKMMMQGVEIYCRGIACTVDSLPPCKDGYLSPYLRDIINSLIKLLSGPGHFDGASCDSALRAIAAKYEIEGVDQ